MRLRRLVLTMHDQIAFLGPSGTYGEAAAKHFQRRLRGGVLVPCPTIPSVYHHPAPYLVLPIHNTLHGVVTDTADCMLSALAGGDYPRVVADTALQISHQLVALKGVSLGDIHSVRSHEQALGQSRVWLDEHLPHAERIPWPSTAGAAASLIHEQRRDVAAICSSGAVELLAGDIDVLHDGTQGIKENYTQFVLLARGAVPDIVTRGRGERAAYFACGGDVAGVGGIGKEGYEWPRPAQGEDGDWTLVKRVDVGDEIMPHLPGVVCLGVYDVENVSEEGRRVMNPGDVDAGLDAEPTPN